MMEFFKLFTVSKKIYNKTQQPFGVNKTVAKQSGILEKFNFRNLITIAPVTKVIKLRVQQTNYVLQFP